MYISYGGQKAIQDEHTAHCLRKAELHRLMEENMRESGRSEGPNHRRSRRPELTMILRQVKALMSST